MRHGTVTLNMRLVVPLSHYSAEVCIRFVAFGKVCRNGRSCRRLCIEGPVWLTIVVAFRSQKFWASIFNIIDLVSPEGKTLSVC